MLKQYILNHALYLTNSLKNIKKWCDNRATVTILNRNYFMTSTRENIHCFLYTNRNNINRGRNRKDGETETDGEDEDRDRLEDRSEDGNRKTDTET